MNKHLILKTSLIAATLLFCGCASASRHTVRFTPDTERVLDNPLSGWVMYLGRPWDSDFWEKQGYDHMVTSSGDTVRVSDYATTAYIRTSWSSLEPEEGVYTWRDTSSRIYRLFKTVQDRGMRLAFRIVVDGRDQGQNTPMYVIDAGAKYYTIGNGKHKSPYPDDPVFQKAYEKFITALAEDFNDPERVEFIDAYGLGKWGESHGMVYSDASKKHEVFDWITTLYTTTFSKVPLVIHYHRVIGVGNGESYGGVAPDTDSLLVSAINKGYSLRHDAFGMTDYYQDWERKFASDWNFRRPIIFEGGWITAAHHRYWRDPCGMYREGHSEDVRSGEYLAAKEAHVNMMDLRINDETRSWFGKAFDLVKGFVSEGGYRLAPVKVSVPSRIRNGRRFTVTHSWQNLGWGYCPNNIPQWNYKFKPAFALLDGSGTPVKLFVDYDAEPSEWLKGEVYNYKKNFDLADVAPGHYTWAVAVVDTASGCKAGIELSLPEELILENGWTEFGSVTVK